jgi:hypothetical protein
MFLPLPRNVIPPGLSTLRARLGSVGSQPSLSMMVYRCGAWGIFLEPAQLPGHAGECRSLSMMVYRCGAWGIFLELAQLPGHAGECRSLGGEEFECRVARRLWRRRSRTDVT